MVSLCLDPLSWELGGCFQDCLKMRKCHKRHERLVRWKSKRAGDVSQRPLASELSQLNIRRPLEENKGFGYNQVLGVLVRHPERRFFFKRCQVLKLSIKERATFYGGSDAWQGRGTDCVVLCEIDHFSPALSSDTSCRTRMPCVITTTTWTRSNDEVTRLGSPIQES